MRRWIAWALVFAGADAVLMVARFLAIRHLGLDDGHISDLLVGVVAAVIAGRIIQTETA